MIPLVLPSRRHVLPGDSLSVFDVQRIMDESRLRVDGFFREYRGPSSTALREMLADSREAVDRAMRARIGTYKTGLSEADWEHIQQTADARTALLDVLRGDQIDTIHQGGAVISRRLPVDRKER